MKLALKFKDFPALRDSNFQGLPRPLTFILKFNDLRMLEKIVEQDFQPNFWVNFTCFFFPFSPASLTESCSFCYTLQLERSLSPEQVR